MEERINASVLLSFYGPLLTPKQQQSLRLHYEEDLSLSEIAEMSGVSRQGVYDAIHRGEEQLVELERRLGLRARWVRICEGLRRSREALEEGKEDLALEIINGLLTEEEGIDGL